MGNVATLEGSLQISSHGSWDIKTFFFSGPNSGVQIAWKCDIYVFKLSAIVIQKLIILECKNGLVGLLSNIHDSIWYLSVHIFP